jgi:hypothetical protein
MRRSRFFRSLGWLLRGILAGPIPLGALSTRGNGFTPLDSGPLLPALRDLNVSDPDARAILATIPNHLMGTAAYAPGMMVPLHAGFAALGDARKRLLPLSDAAVVATRSTARMDCEYVFSNWLHLLAVLPSSLTDGGFDGSWNRTKLSEVFRMSSDAVARGDGPWSPRQRRLIKIVDEQVDKGRTNDLETMRSALSLLSGGEVVEALMIHGLFGTYCGIAKGLRVEIETSSTVPDRIIDGWTVNLDEIH